MIDDGGRELRRREEAENVCTKAIATLLRLLLSLFFIAQEKIYNCVSSSARRFGNSNIIRWNCRRFGGKIRTVGFELVEYKLLIALSRFYQHSGFACVGSLTFCMLVQSTDLGYLDMCNVEWWRTDSWTGQWMEEEVCMMTRAKCTIRMLKMTKQRF